MLEDIIRISDELGLKVNPKKTQISKIDKGFVFLKQVYFITDTGRIVIKPCKKNTARMRRKLKKWKKKMDAGEMQFEDILNAYRSWRGSIEKINSHRTSRSMDILFQRLFNSHPENHRRIH